MSSNEYLTIIKNAKDIIQNRNNFIYSPPLNLTFSKIKDIYHVSNENGINPMDWLQGTSLYVALKYKEQTQNEISKLNYSKEKQEDMQSLATLLQLNLKTKNS